MFGSQALETVIGLVLMFFVVAAAASSLVEVVGRVLSKRSNDLESAIGAMLSGADALDEDLANALIAFKGTTIYDAAKAASGRKLFRRKSWKNPSYLSAKSFADAVLEMSRTNLLDARTAIAANATATAATATAATAATATDPATAATAAAAAATATANAAAAAAAAAEAATIASNSTPLEEILRGLPDFVAKRVRSIIDDGGTTVLEVKSGLENWFDGSMERLSGAYKRWTTTIIFGVGLLIAITANASVFHVADELWNDAPLREAVADSADTVVIAGDKGLDVTTVAATEAQLEELSLPIGWTDKEEAEWRKHGADVFQWTADQWAHIAGWFGTALLVMLGAPFWFDVLTKAVSLRSSGAKPDSAPKDETSATSELARP